MAGSKGRGTNQPNTVEYTGFAVDYWHGRADKEEAKGRHAKALEWRQRADTFRSDYELRTGGPKSAYVPVGLLLQKSKAAAAAYDPDNVHRWEDAHRDGHCIVTKHSDRVFLRCTSVRHGNQQPCEIGRGNGIVHSDFLKGGWNCRACADAHRAPGTSQPTTQAYLQWLADEMLERARLAEDAQEDDQAENYRQKHADLFEMEVRLAGPGSPYVSVRLLLQKTEADAAACNPGQVQFWKEARQPGHCIVGGSRSDKVFLRCTSVRHKDQKPREIGYGKGISHGALLRGSWGCKACFGIRCTDAKEDVQRRLNARGYAKFQVEEYLGAHRTAKVVCPDHGIFEVRGLNLVKYECGIPCPTCSELAGNATSEEEKLVLRAVTLAMGVPRSSVRAAAGALTKTGSQASIGRSKVDALVELRASQAADAKIVQLVLESMGAIWHGDRRVPQHMGKGFYTTLVLGATGCEKFVRTIKRRADLAALGFPMLEIWPFEGIKALRKVGNPRAMLGSRLSLLIKEHPQAERICKAACEGLDSQAYDHAVAELTRGNVTLEDVLANKEYLRRYWEDGEFLVIASRRDAMLSCVSAPYPFNTVKYLTDNVDDKLAGMDQQEKAWAQTLQAVFKAIVAEPEHTVASLQAMMITPPPVAQEAPDLPSTPVRRPLAGEEGDLSPYIASPGVHTALEQAATAGVDVPLQPMFGISKAAADAATPTKTPVAAAKGEGVEPGTKGSPRRLAFGGPSTGHPAARTETWASPQRATPSRTPPRKTLKRAAASPAAAPAAAPLAAAAPTAAARSVPSGTITAWFRPAGGGAQGAMAPAGAAGRGGGGAAGPGARQRKRVHSPVKMKTLSHFFTTKKLGKE